MIKEVWRGHRADNYINPHLSEELMAHNKCMEPDMENTCHNFGHNLVIE
jgi:hypothetical protein